MSRSSGSPGCFGPPPTSSSRPGRRDPRLGRALHQLGTEVVDVETAARTLGVAVKYRGGRRPGPDDARPDPVPVTTLAPDALLLGFARALRAAGLPVTADRESTYLLAVATVGMSDRAATYWAGRATLCSGPEDIERYDQVFTGWFGGERGLTSVPPERTRPQVWLDSDEGAVGQPTGDPDDEVLKVAASAAEVLRHRDVTTLTAAEKRLLAATIDTLRPGPRCGEGPVGCRAGAARSTRTAPCAPSSSTSVSRPTSPGGADTPDPDGSSCSSTSPAR